MIQEGFFYKNGNLLLRRLFIVTFIVEIGIFIAVSSLNVQNNGLLSVFKSEQQSITSMSLIAMIFQIFPHNLLVATIEFIPLIGQLLFVISSASTALILALEGSSMHVSGLVVFFSLAIVPHTWLELPSYAVATSTSIYLIYLIVERGRILSDNIKKVFYMYLFVVFELAIAAIFESIEIVILKAYPSIYGTIFSIALWIPAIPVIYLLIKLYRRIDENEYYVSTSRQKVT
ncbi:MAG: stage II sporulation protein M [Thermoplasmata archaeon]